MPDVCCLVVPPLPQVRGQRTKNNARTRKGKAKPIAGKKVSNRAILSEIVGAFSRSDASFTVLAQ